MAAIASQYAALKGHAEESMEQVLELPVMVHVYTDDLKGGVTS